MVLWTKRRNGQYPKYDFLLEQDIEWRRRRLAAKRQKERLIDLAVFVGLILLLASALTPFVGRLLNGR